MYVAQVAMLNGLVSYDLVGFLQKLAVASIGSITGGGVLVVNNH
jgi:hypothetical protein